MIQDVYVASEVAHKTMFMNSRNIFATFQHKLTAESNQLIKQKLDSLQSHIQSLQSPSNMPVINATMS